MSGVSGNMMSECGHRCLRRPPSFASISILIPSMLVLIASLNQGKPFISYHKVIFPICVQLRR